MIRRIDLEPIIKRDTDASTRPNASKPTARMSGPTNGPRVGELPAAELAVALLHTDGTKINDITRLR
jgi:hypothetical protein